MTQCEAHLGDLSSSGYVTKLNTSPLHPIRPATASSNCHRFIQLGPPPLYATQRTPARATDRFRANTRRLARKGASRPGIRVKILSKNPQRFRGGGS
jgi:hypothetical protein